MPVIFLTAMDQTTDEAQGFELGAADYMTKPVNPPILKAQGSNSPCPERAAWINCRSAFDIIKKHKDRMQEELNVGRDIQMSMLPVDFPAFPERKRFRFRPC